MAKLTLKANPTFKANVGICVAGADPVEVSFTFKHRTKDELKAFMESRKDKSDTETILEMCVGWELEDPFNKESVDELLQNYIGSGLSAYLKYVEELQKHKTKN